MIETGLLQHLKHVLRSKSVDVQREAVRCVAASIDHYSVGVLRVVLRHELSGLWSRWRVFLESSHGDTCDHTLELSQVPIGSCAKNVYRSSETWGEMHDLILWLGRRCVANLSAEYAHTVRASAQSSPFDSRDTLSSFPKSLRFGHCGKVRLEEIRRRGALELLSDRGSLSSPLSTVPTATVSIFLDFFEIQPFVGGGRRGRRFAAHGAHAQLARLPLPAARARRPFPEFCTRDWSKGQSQNLMAHSVRESSGIISSRNTLHLVSES